MRAACWRPDTPAELVEARGAATLEDAFISYLEEAAGAARRSRATAEQLRRQPSSRRNAPTRSARVFSLQRLLAYTIREVAGAAARSDPARLRLLGTALLMLVFGFGISTDVNNLSFAALDRDQTSGEPRLSRGAAGARPISSRSRRSPTMPSSTSRLKSGDITAAIEIPPGFGRDIKRGRPAWVSAWIDGAMPFRAETIRGYLQGMHQLYLTDPASRRRRVAAASPPADIEVRFKYNQDFDSIYAMVPSTIVAAARAVSRRS